MSETNLSSGTETSDESSGSGGDNDDDQIPAISDRNPEYHESQQRHEYIDQVLNDISIPQSGGAFCRNQSYSSTSSLSTVSTSNQNSAHQVTGSTNHSSNRMVCKVFTLTSPVEKVWFFLNKCIPVHTQRTKWFLLLMILHLLSK